MTQVSKSSTLSLRFCNSRTLLFISFISNTLPCSQLFGRQGTHGWLLPCNRSHFVFSIRSNWGRKYYRFILGSAQGKRKHSISWVVTVFPISNTCISSVVILTAADTCKVFFWGGGGGFQVCESRASWILHFWISTGYHYLFEEFVSLVK